MIVETPQHLAIACEIYRLTPKNKITFDELYNSIKDYYFFKQDEVLKSIRHLSKWGFLEYDVSDEDRLLICISEEDKGIISYISKKYFDDKEKKCLNIIRC